MTDGTARVLGGRYRLGRLLGSGGMADVHEATDERLARPVAVKVMKAGLARDEGAAARFASEARSAAKLSHPNVVNVFDTGEDDGQPWLVMERLSGRTLADELRKGQVDQERLRGWIVEALSALGAAHRAGIVHRDVKPGNILLTDDGHTKVADFGIAKSIEPTPGDIDLTSTGMLLGTPAYLAPERIEGSPATPRSDLFAIGVIVWEALVGRKPFEGATPIATAAKVQSEVAPPVGTLRPGADPRLAAAAERAMAKSPEDRPANAEEMAAIISGAAPLPAPLPTVAMATTDATVAMAPVTRTQAVRPAAAVPVRRSRNAGPIVAGLLVFLLFLVAGLAYLASRDDGDDVTATSTTLPSVSSSTGPTTTVAGTTTTRPGSRLAAAIRDEAGRVEGRDEPAAGEVADRLQSLADLVESGSSTQGSNATRLRNDLYRLVAADRLTNATAKEVESVIDDVPGIGPVTTTTAAPTTTTSTTRAPTTTTRVTIIPGDGEGGGGNGNGNNGRGAGAGEKDRLAPG